MKKNMHKYLLLFIVALLSCKDEAVVSTEITNGTKPEAHVVAYDTPGEGNVYVFNTRTKTLVKVTANVVDTFYFAYTGSFSEDGTEFLYTLDYRKLGKEDLLFCDRTDIFLFNLINGKTTRISNTEYKEVNPRFSKDGKTIVYASWETGRPSICTINKEGNNKKVLISNSGYNYFPQFVMDDKKILYSSNRGGRYEFYLYDLASGTEEQLTNGNYGAKASVSSDWSFFFFSGKEGIYKYDFATKAVTLMLNGNSNVKWSYNPLVSSDSKYVVYQYFDGSWIYNRMMTTEGKLLVDFGKGTAVAFTKDGKNVVLLKRDGTHLYNIESKKDSILIPTGGSSYDLAVGMIK